VAAAGEPKLWTCPICGRANPPDFAVCPNDGTPRADQAATHSDPLLGEVLGRTYRVTKKIGEGGMARLYEAEHLRIDARFAVKIIHADLARDPDLLVRFEREARAAGRIRSPQVVRLIDVLRTADGRPCIVTELLEGEDLQTRLDRAGKLTVAQAIPIARQICQAAAAAHAVGVVHRDLKPSNVFLCASGEVKVFDFGVAKLDGDDKLTRTEAVMGTAAYMAPEQARRAADADALADVYSIGAILYHALTGIPPYGNVPALSRFALVLHEEPQRPRAVDASIPAGVEGVIQQAMARDRAGRISSALALEGQLAAFDKPVRAVINTPVVPAPVVDAATFALRARLARPIGVAVAIGSSLALGAWLATMFALAVRPTRTGEHALIAALGLFAAVGLGVLHLRALRASWRSGPAVLRHTQPFALGLVVGTFVLGFLELLAYGMVAAFGVTPLAPAIDLGAAGLAVAVVAAARTWRRRIG
jgi:eukaryotic-like serine/threonine-protein kinase